MDRLGIIGGLGPLATAYYLQLLVDMAEAEYDQDHMEVYLYSCPQIPDRTGHILHPDKVASPLPKMIELGKKLEQDEVKLITIPCITAHYFHRELEKEIHAPIANAVTETAKYLADRHVKRVGVMATDGTIQTKLFQNELEAFGMDVLIPDEEFQEKVMDIIYNQVKKGKPVDETGMNEIESHLKEKGAEVIILGCTELSIVKRDGKVGPGFIDVLDVLANCAVRSCGILKEEYKELITV